MRDCKRIDLWQENTQGERERKTGRAAGVRGINEVDCFANHLILTYGEGQGSFEALQGRLCVLLITRIWNAVVKMADGVGPVPRLQDSSQETESVSD